MSQRLFHQRCRIHKNFYLRMGGTGKPRGNFLELALDQLVVIAIQRIDRNNAIGFVFKPLHGINALPIIHGKYDGRLGLWPHRPWTRTALCRD